MQIGSRSAALALSQIAAFLELRGENKFKVRAYEQAAQSVTALDSQDMGALDSAGALAGTKGLGTATLAVVRDLIETGQSSFLVQLQSEVPEGLIELLDVPGLGSAKIRLLHTELGVDSVDALESAVKSGRIAALKGFGPKTADKLLRSITMYRSSAQRSLFPQGLVVAQQALASVSSRPGVERAEIAGSTRRRLETIGDADVVALCDDPASVAQSIVSAADVKRVERAGTNCPRLTLVDGTRLDLFCASRGEYPIALWRATGSAEHVASVTRILAERGYELRGDSLIDSREAHLPVTSEHDIYSLAGLGWIPPEMREDAGEIARAMNGELPPLIESSDIRGVLHCHSTWSDGKQSIAEMAAGAQGRGWSYIGITDHSAAAFFAGGMSRENVLAQHREIDLLNDSLSDFRVLKGIEADILADGKLDYDDELLAQFDFIIGSVHSRFTMNKEEMTARILRALENPFLTVLGHPTGRLLLSRHPYALDVDAVLVKAADVGAAIELNADPHRLDLDWRYIRRARELGVVIEIGPDSHSTRSLDYMEIGIGIARKGGLAASEVLNTRTANEVLEFAARRRA